MLGIILGVVSGLVVGAYFIASSWVIHALSEQSKNKDTLIQSKNALIESFRKDNARFVTLNGELEVKNKALLEYGQSLKEVAAQAVAREQATMNRPVFLKAEEALMMAETIGSMMDKAKVH